MRSARDLTLPRCVPSNRVWPFYAYEVRKHDSRKDSDRQVKRSEQESGETEVEVYIKFNRRG